MDLRDIYRVEAENLAGRYAAIRNPGRLAKNLRHLIEIDKRKRSRATRCVCAVGPPTGADFDIHDDNCEAQAWSICGSFHARTQHIGGFVTSGASDAAYLENLLVYGGLCRNCLECVKLDRFSKEDRELIAKAWPGETYERFDGATLGMIRTELDRMRERLERGALAAAPKVPRPRVTRCGPMGDTQQ